MNENSLLDCELERLHGLGIDPHLRDIHDVIVAFDCPEKVSSHADVRVEYQRDQVTVEMAYLRGCKTCQNTLSACFCSAPMTSELLVYDRAFGLVASVYKRFIENKARTQNQAGAVSPLREDEIAGLAPDLNFLEDSAGGKLQAQNEFQRVPPQLIAHLLQTFVNIYFSYPQSKLEEMQQLWKSRGRILEIRPLSEPGADTKTARGECAPRGGPSAVITFPRPTDMSMLEQYPEASEGDGPMVVLKDYKLALQLHFDHGFNLSGPKWKD